jgi:hypothetical protein
MKWFVLVVIVLVAAVGVGLTAIDKNDEQSCKDRRANAYRAGLNPAERVCDGFLPW